MKVCSKCNQKKLFVDFPIKKVSKDGYGNRCKLCVREYNKTYDFKKYRLENKNKIIKRSSEYYQKNKNYILDRTKEYFNNHKEEHRSRTKEWYKKNKEYHQTKTKIYIKKRLKEDPIFKLKETLRKRMYDLLIKNKTPKVYSALILLGCTTEECKQHLESQFKPEMNWDNYGNVWEIDHIKPCSSFDLTDIEQQKQCFHYTNLQPLFKLENRKKYNKILD